MSRGGARRRSVYLDIAPILETQWTGIPLVTAQLARRGLTDAGRRWHFLYNNQLVSRAFVTRALRARSGRWIEGRLLDTLRGCELPSFAEMRDSVGIFPNVKPVRRAFLREAIVVHDLSTLLMPEYHHPDTVLHHANRLRRDIDTSDALICVSRATADDLKAYFKVPDDRIVVAPLGVSWSLRTRLEAAELLEGVALPPFVLVLGTVEPRKNIGLVLDYITRNAAVLDEFCFVFVGRDGWLEERHRLEAHLARHGLDPSRVVFTGFVSEAVKLALLCAAAFTIFPSLFEGFGLPVLESLSVGRPVLCSFSSSLPEVVDESCVLFDPTNADSFAAAFAEMVRETRARRRAPTDPRDAHVSTALGWTRFFRAVDGWLEGADDDGDG